MPRGRTSPVGATMINALGYQQTKVANGKWVGSHILILEKKLGRKLQPGERAIFDDGDKTNLDPDNIVLGGPVATKSIRARIAKLEAEIEDRKGVIEDLKRALAQQEQNND